MRTAVHGELGEAFPPYFVPDNKPQDRNTRLIQRF